MSFPRNLNILSNIHLISFAQIPRIKPDQFTPQEDSNIHNATWIVVIADKDKVIFCNYQILSKKTTPCEFGMA